MRKLLLWIFLLGVLCHLPGAGQAQVSSPYTVSTQPKSVQSTPKWTAIITAHPDDWQLFMGAAICEEARYARRKIVFICLTGGQADVPSDDYWQTREAGHRASVQQAANPQATMPASTPAEKVVVNGHFIDVFRSGSMAAFYLHLPDGGVSGKGLARGKFQSLQLLRDQNRAITPLSGGAPYTSWNDLAQTVRALLAREAILGQLTIHLPQSDARCNPGDHSDHYMAGALGLHMMKELECRFFQYVGYDVSKRPVNLTATQLNNQRQVYRAYCQTMVAHGQEDPWDAKHLAFVGHQYMQVKHQAGPRLQPTGPPPTVEPRGSVDDDDDDDQLLAQNLVFLPAFPNPLAGSSQLTYDLPVAAPVWLRILDMQGREIMQFFHGETQPAGRHEQWLDVQRLPAAGSYVAELRVGRHVRRQHLAVAR